MTPQQILTLRTSLGLSQETFAERLGVRRATISDWERGAKVPSPMAEKLLAQLKEEAKQ